MQSQHTQDMKQILAALQEPGAGGEQKQPLPDEELVNTVYIYPTDQGGLLFTPTRLPGDEEDKEPPIIDSQQTAPRREPPHFLYFLLLLLFLLLDSADSTITALMTPTATITIMPQVRTITFNSTTKLGKLLSPITLSESQTVPATGHGHQNAREATGTVIFYNTAFTQQTVDAGTVLTGADGVKIITDETISLPPDNPPVNGQAIVSAHALDPGVRGNIPDLDINGIFSSALYVKNLTSFRNGQNSRDYMVVTKADRDTTASILKTKVAASMTAALQGQAIPGEQVQIQPCTPTVSTNHPIGGEATQLTVTVLQICTAIAYNTQELTAQATRQMTTQATKKLGQGYTLYGDVKVTVTQATTQTQTVVLLTFTTQGTYVYQLSTTAQQRIKNLVAGKPRETALHQLAILPGIQQVSITGIPDNQQLPTDATHIHLTIFILSF